MNIEFNPQNFIENLPYMGKGMLAIMVVIGVIILVTTALNKLLSNKKK